MHNSSYLQAPSSMAWAELARENCEIKIEKSILSLKYIAKISFTGINYWLKL